MMKERDDYVKIYSLLKEQMDKMDQNPKLLTNYFRSKFENLVFKQIRGKLFNL